jgi:hypothetical protein
MAKKILYSCDFPGCDRIRTETNHWFIVVWDDSMDTLTILPFDENYDGNQGDKCFCGETHTLQHIGKMLSHLHQLEESGKGGGKYALNNNI